MRFKNKTQKDFKRIRWSPFTVTRVKLNPEQAVLSCCDSTGRDLAVTTQGKQCIQYACDVGWVTDTPSS